MTTLRIVTNTTATTVAIANASSAVLVSVVITQRDYSLYWADGHRTHVPAVRNGRTAGTMDKRLGIEEDQKSDQELLKERRDGVRSCP